MSPVSQIDVYGKVFPCKYINIDIVNVDLLSHVVQKEFVGLCCPLETPVVTKLGNSFTLLSNPEKLTLDIGAVEADKIRCAVLEGNIHPETETTMKALLTFMPASNTAFPIAKRIKNILGNPKVMEWLNSSYGFLRTKNMKDYTFLEIIIGKLRCSKSIKSYDPNKTPTAKDIWNTIVNDIGGFPYCEMRKRLPKPRLKWFQATILANEDGNTLPDFFAEMNNWASTHPVDPSCRND